MCALNRIIIALMTFCAVTPISTERLRRLTGEISRRETHIEPKPCKSGVVCDDEDDYPKKLVEKMLKQNKALLAPHPVLENAEDIDNSTGNIRALCETRRKYVIIRKAQNTDGVWRYVLNDGNQYYYVELCSNNGASCSFDNYMPSGYRVLCKQKYVHYRLQALVGEKNLMDDFPIPSCCYCSVTPS